MVQYTLTVAASRDGFIARATNHPPQAWASPEEQVLFYSDVDAADWVILGRHTHLAADRPERRRIVFSRSLTGWQRPTQIWVDPENLKPQDLPGLVEKVQPLNNGLILGGTTVHDWFHRHEAIDRVHLTVEPVDFGEGLPIFSGQTETDPVEVFLLAGYVPISQQTLNAAGTRYLVMERGH